jgi:hypothetical protein
MTTTIPKPITPQFMPAPRPTQRLSAEDATRLKESSADLGFARPMDQSDLTKKPQTTKQPNVHLTTALPSQTPKKSDTSSSPSRVAIAGMAKVRAPEDLFGNAQPLRLDVPQDLWFDLKITAAKRRVSVRWLVLEALEKAGYDVSLSAIPEDGRRVRNNV